jgi:hypothetical protein
MLKAVHFGLAMFIAFAFLHWAIFFFFRPANRSHVLMRLTAAILLWTLLRFTAFTFSPNKFGAEVDIARAVAACVSFGCLWILYMPFYYSIQTSISISMLIRLVEV